MFDFDVRSTAILFIFVVGYLGMAFEKKLKINKATTALLMGVSSWVVEFSFSELSKQDNLLFFGNHLSSIAQVVLFFMGGLAIADLLYACGSFSWINQCLRTRSVKKIFFILSVISFFLSAVIGSVAATIVLCTFVVEGFHRSQTRLIIGAGIVLAANAGGVWSPTGNITTTMLWMGGQLTTEVMGALVLPSLVCWIVSMFFLQFSVSGAHDWPEPKESITSHYMTYLLLFLGIVVFSLVPLFKIWTGLPPFIGILFGLGMLWCFTDFFFKERQVVGVSLLSKVDFSGIVFFLGVLLTIDAIETSGLLGDLAQFFDPFAEQVEWITISLGMVSAFINNVPVVAAIMGMFSVEVWPRDHTFWVLVAYCSGVGGSILAFGSAPGVAYMGLERVDFLWYIKKISFPALMGYFGGLFIYWLLA